MRILELININKTYSKRRVLNKINLKFKEGKCYLLVGANGSGKSTILKIILGFVYPDNHYKEYVIYKNFNSIKIGYVPEKIILPSNITIKSFLNLICELRNEDLQKVNHYLEYWDLKKDENKKLKQLSKGMLQKVLIIQAFLGDPNIFIFDEALNGLDPNMQRRLIELISLEKMNKKIIIITSHYPQYYEQIIDERIILNEGKISIIEKLN